MNRASSEAVTFVRDGMWNAHWQAQDDLSNLGGPEMDEKNRNLEGGYAMQAAPASSRLRRTIRGTARDCTRA